MYSSPVVLIQNPTNFSVSVINSTCIVLKWSPPVLSWYNGPLLNYSIEIIPQMDATQRSLISTVQTVLILSSLHPFYNYTCTVTAYTAAGEGPSTLPITVTTLQDGEAHKHTITIFHNMPTTHQQYQVDLQSTLKLQPLVLPPLEWSGSLQHHQIRMASS